MTAPRWYDDFPELDEPLDTLSAMRARTDAALAARRRFEEEYPDRDLTAEAMEAIGDAAAGLDVDEGLVAMWLDSASRDWDVDPEAAA